MKKSDKVLKSIYEKMLIRICANSPKGSTMDLFDDYFVLHRSGDESDEMFYLDYKDFKKSLFAV